MTLGAWSRLVLHNSCLSEGLIEVRLRRLILQGLRLRPDLGYELLAAGGALVFGTAYISLAFQPIIMIYIPPWERFNGVSIFPWALLLFVLGSALTVAGAFYSHSHSSLRKRLTRVLLGLAGAVVMAHSVFALVAAYGVMEAPRWMMRNKMFYGHDHVPFVKIYTEFFYLALGLSLTVAAVGLHSLKHRFRPGIRGVLARVGIFLLGTLAVFMLRATLFRMP